jgi:hypothetical protein
MHDHSGFFPYHKSVIADNIVYYLAIFGFFVVSQVARSVAFTLV